MTFFTLLRRGKSWLSTLIVLGLLFSSVNLLLGQPETNSAIPGPGEISLTLTNTPATNAPAETTPPAPETTSQPPAPALTQAPTLAAAPVATPALSVPASILAGLMTFASVGGFLLYQCGLTRAKNSGHTSTLLLVGVLFALTG